MDGPNILAILSAKGFELEKTCGMCPEQYDVYYQEKQVGYLRLRHGHFSCEYPDAGGEVIYEAYPMGDGSFLNEEERATYLLAAIEELQKKVKPPIKYLLEEVNKEKSND